MIACNSESWKSDIRASQAKTKAWFGVLSCFEKLDHEWSILEEVMSMANGSHELDTAAGQQESTERHKT